MDAGLDLRWCALWHCGCCKIRLDNSPNEWGPSHPWETGGCRCLNISRWGQTINKENISPQDCQHAPQHRSLWNKPAETCCPMAPDFVGSMVFYVYSRTGHVGLPKDWDPDTPLYCVVLARDCHTCVPFTQVIRSEPAKTSAQVRLYIEIYRVQLFVCLYFCTCVCIYIYIYIVFKYIYIHLVRQHGDLQAPPRDGDQARPRRDVRHDGLLSRESRDQSRRITWHFLRKKLVAHYCIVLHSRMHGTQTAP